VRNVRFAVQTPLGFTVRTTEEYWERIITEKHRNMRARETEVRSALAEPDVVRQSVADSHVLLFYRSCESNWIVAVVRRQNGEGFLITCYLAATIKKGTEIWKRK
jgi:hypothetical protein